MKRKCDNCDRPATHHSVEIIKGQKIEKHLCDQCAADEGLAVPSAHTPINELLTNFVKLHSGGGGGEASAGKGGAATKEQACSSCGLTFAAFREQSLLGCPQCYSDFESSLSTLLERAHEGGTHHVGKVPRRAGRSEVRQQQLMRLRKRLESAVTEENYELAARLRDEINQFQEQGE